MNRRRFLSLALSAAASGFAPSLAPATSDLSADALLGPERRLRLYHARTSETFEQVYYVDGVYQEESVNALDRLMRDYSADEATPMDVRLYDLLAMMQAALELRQPLHVTSGYRTRATNDRLRLEGRNPGQNSLHLYGMAADIYAPGMSVPDLEHMALALKQGGVGGYRSAGFVHLDVGRFRRWRQ